MAKNKNKFDVDEVYQWTGEQLLNELKYLARTEMRKNTNEWLSKWISEEKIFLHLNNTIANQIINFDLHKLIADKISSILFECEYKFDSRIEKLENKIESLSRNQDALFEMIKNKI